MTTFSQILHTLEKLPQRDKMIVGGLEFAVGGSPIRMGVWNTNFKDLVNTLEKM